MPGNGDDKASHPYTLVWVSCPSGCRALSPCAGNIDTPDPPDRDCILLPQPSRKLLASSGSAPYWCWPYSLRKRFCRLFAFNNRHVGYDASHMSNVETLAIRRLHMKITDGASLCLTGKASLATATGSFGENRLLGVVTVHTDEGWRAMPFRLLQAGGLCLLGPRDSSNRHIGANPLDSGAIWRGYGRNGRCRPTLSVPWTWP